MGLKHILIFAIKLLLKYEYFFNKNICLIKVGIYFIKNKFWYVNVNFKLKKKSDSFLPEEKCGKCVRNSRVLKF